MQYPVLELEHFAPPITEISPSISRLTHLRLINLWKNRISSLPDEFTSLHALQTCLLHFNEFYKIPQQLFKLTNLERLTLRGNHVSEIPFEISHLMKLTFLSVRQNRIAYLPPAVFKLTNLQSLLLARNDIYQVCNLWSNDIYIYEGKKTLIISFYPFKIITSRFFICFWLIIYFPILNTFPLLNFLLFLSKLNPCVHSIVGFYMVLIYDCRCP